MKEVATQENKEIQSKIASIKENMQCSRSFACLSGGLENFGRANNFTGGDYPECKEKTNCQFKSEYGFLYLCRCPLRMYMFSKIKIEKPPQKTAFQS